VDRAIFQNAEVIFDHADRLYDQRKFQSAIYYLNRLVELKPLDKNAWFRRGQCREELNDAPGALADYSEALRLDDTFTEALFNRAMLHYQAEKYGFALTDFSQLLAIPGSGPTTTVYYGSPANGTLGAVSQLMTMQNRQAPIYHYLGLCKLKTADYAGALAEFDRALALTPNDPTYWVNRGLAQQRLGHKNAALSDFQRALALDPENSHAAHNLSLLDPGSQRTVAAYDRIIDQNSNFAPAYVNRGLAKFEQGNFAGALADFDRAVTLGQRDYEIYVNRALAKARLKDYPGAIKDFGRAIGIEPHLAKGYAGRGNVYLQLKNFGSAIEDYDLAIAIDPTEAHFYYNRGLAHHQQKQSAQACADWQKAVQFGATNAKQPYLKFCR